MTSLPRFVLHDHHSRHHHFDLRLERDGVLKSWALPRGLPEQPGERRLAIEVEDHPLEYAGFSGTIADGEYGAGTVEIADEGIYETKEWAPEKIEVVLAGRQISGTYLLIRFKKAGERGWLVLKVNENSRPGRKA